MKPGKRSKTYLVSRAWQQFPNDILPTNKDVLRRYFYYQDKDESDVKNKVTEELVEVWQTKHSLPVLAGKVSIQRKLSELYDKWKCLQKNSSSTTDAHRSKEDSFRKALTELFDISHTNILQELAGNDS